MRAALALLLVLLQVTTAEAKPARKPACEPPQQAQAQPCTLNTFWLCGDRDGE